MIYNVVWIFYKTLLTTLSVIDLGNNDENDDVNDNDVACCNISNDYLYL